MRMKDLEKMMEVLADFKLLQGKYEQLKAENKRLITQNEKLVSALTSGADALEQR